MVLAIALKGVSLCWRERLDLSCTLMVLQYIFPINPNSLVSRTFVVLKALVRDSISHARPGCFNASGGEGVSRCWQSPYKESHCVGNRLKRSLTVLA